MNATQPRKKSGTSRHNKAQHLAQIRSREEKRAKRNHARTVADWFEAHSD